MRHPPLLNSQVNHLGHVLAASNPMHFLLTFSTKNAVALDILFTTRAYWEQEML
jgi:hypothetical protein